MYKIGRSRLFDYLDIKEIIHKFQELSLLKIILLNEDQRNLLKFIPKPEISLTKDDKLLNKATVLYESVRGKRYSDACKNGKNKQNIIEEKIKMSYMGLRREKTEVNERILELCEKDLKNYLQIDNDFFDKSKFFILDY